MSLDTRILSTVPGIVPGPTVYVAIFTVPRDSRVGPTIPRVERAVGSRRSGWAGSWLNEREFSALRGHHGLQPKWRLSSASLFVPVNCDADDDAGENTSTTQ